VAPVPLRSGTSVTNAIELAVDAAPATLTLDDLTPEVLRGRPMIASRIANRDFGRTIAMRERPCRRLGLDPLGRLCWRAIYTRRFAQPNGIAAARQ
jgi:hypothetical protein